MKYLIRHITQYHYSMPASLSHNEVFLHLRSKKTQRVDNSRIDIFPEPQYIHQRLDFFGNSAHVFMVQQPHEELRITSTSRVETSSSPDVRGLASMAWEMVGSMLKAHQSMETLDAYQFVFPSPLISYSTDVMEYARQSFLPGRPVVEAAVELMGRVYADFSYDKEATTVDTSVAQVMRKRSGVCQDFAHVVISCLRSMGLAARYVSGYLETQPPPGKKKLIGADASHAWLSLYVPDFGWLDIDPTNNMIPGEQHVTIGWGRDYSDVTPAKGVVMGGGSHTLCVSVSMEPE